MGKCAIFDDEQIKTFEYDEDTDVELKFLSKEEAKELSKEVDKLVARTGSDRQSIWDQKLAERCVIGWHHRTRADHPGFVMPNGTPIPFTAENRDMMIKRNREFSLFVSGNTIDASVFLEISKAGEKREVTKNS